MIDYYQILETHPQASQDEIKAAYRKAAQKYHPDKNKESQTAEEKFKLVNEANEILSNPEKRKEYDIEYFQQLDFSARFKEKTSKLEEESLPSYVTGIVNTIKIKANREILNELYAKNKIVDRVSYKAKALVDFQGFSIHRPDEATIEEEIKYFLTVRTKPFIEVTKSQINVPDELIEEFISSFQEDLIQKNNLTQGSLTEKDKWRAKFRLLILGDFIDKSNQEKVKIILLEYENTVLQYMEFKLSRIGERDNSDILSVIKELNSNYKINGVKSLDRVGQLQLLNSFFIPTHHPDFKIWVDNMSSSYKLEFLDEIGAAITTLSDSFKGDFQQVLTQIMGALIINQKLRLMVRTEEEKIEFEKIEDKVHNNLEKFLLNTDDINNASSSTWQEDILDLLIYANDNFKEDRRLIKKIQSIKEKLQKKSKEGCYIATACYGSYSSPEVVALRRYRDNILIKSFFGRKLVKLYYKLSPSLAKVLINQKKLNLIVKRVLNLIVERVEKTRYNKVQNGK